MNFKMLILFRSKKHLLSITRYWLLLLFLAARNLVAESWQPPAWNSAGGQTLRQQQQYLRQQQKQWKQQDQRALQKRQQQEQKKWEREQKKREKSSLTIQQPAACSL
jgi:hypothetical protein